MKLITWGGVPVSMRPVSCTVGRPNDGSSELDCARMGKLPGSWEVPHGGHIEAIGCQDHAHTRTLATMAIGGRNDGAGHVSASDGGFRSVAIVCTQCWYVKTIGPGWRQSSAWRQVSPTPTRWSLEKADPMMGGESCNRRNERLAPENLCRLKRRVA